MKKKSNIYFILTYLFFIYPPFIWGLVEIYQTGSYDSIHITSLIINLILIIIIASVCSLLIYKEKLHIPSVLEWKYLIFGVVGNVVVYFYTFQNFMDIENLITIYLILLIVLAVHFLLISKKFSPVELWILLPIFLFIDYAHLLITGCGFTNSWSCNPSYRGNLLYFLYVPMFLAPLIYYVYKIYLFKLTDSLKFANMVLIVILSIFFQFVDILDEKVISTIAIALPFLTIMDFIVSIINKKYTHKVLFFYIRTYSVLLIFGILGAFEFFKGEADQEILVIMVIFTYYSLFINIFQSLLKVDQITEIKKISRHFIVQLCNPELHALLVEQYGKDKAEYVKMDENSFSLIATREDRIVGFISSTIHPLEKPFDLNKEANVTIIEVNELYQNQGIASKLVEKTEKHFKSLGFMQVRGYHISILEKALQMWKKLGYVMVPDENGYHFIKKL